jgi:transposase-like protein
LVILEKNHQDFDITKVFKKQTPHYNHSRDCFNLKEKIKNFQEIKKRWFPDYYVEKVRKEKGK